MQSEKSANLYGGAILRKPNTFICHQEDGPAIEYANGDKEYWLNGKQINCNSNKEFKRLIKLKLFI